MDTFYSTAEVARQIGVSKSTLLRWLYADEIPEPEQKITVGKMDGRLWTLADLNIAKEYKEQNYRKRS